MDGSQFDRMTQDLAKITSRRTLIKSLLGIGGAFVAGSRFGIDRAHAAHRGFPGPSLPGNLPMPPICPDGQTWNGATCVCASGISCDAGCCGDGTVCVDGSCVTPPPSCPDGQAWNGSACECISGATCGASCCGDGTTCTSGACVANPGCIPTGQSCTQSSDCCTTLCVDSFCRVRTGGGGCFVGETRIAMADGTSRPIADIAEGNLVLGDDGRINRVLGIDRLTLDDRLLYGLNGSQPFVTASHPFMTEDGWKAVDPTHTYVDHRLPAVGRLEVGSQLVLLSRVLVAAAAGMSASPEAILEIQTEPRTLTSLQGVAAPASTQLYNLRLDGNHTYFANDLLVHNKIFQAPIPGAPGAFLG